MTRDQILEQVESLQALALKGGDPKIVFTGIFELIVSQQVQINELQKVVASNNEMFKTLMAGGKIPTQMGRSNGGGFSIG